MRREGGRVCREGSERKEEGYRGEGEDKRRKGWLRIMLSYLFTCVSIIFGLFVYSFVYLIKFRG